MTNKLNLLGNIKTCSNNSKECDDKRKIKTKFKYRDKQTPDSNQFFSFRLTSSGTSAKKINFWWSKGINIEIGVWKNKINTTKSLITLSEKHFEN